MPPANDAGGRWEPYKPDPAKGGHFEPYHPITEPGEAAESAAQTVAGLPAGVTKVLGRAIPMTVGGKIGAVVGGAAGSLVGAPEAGAMIGAPIGAGVGNIAGKYLPKELGGDPTESTLGAFGWGAVPEMVGRGIAGAVAKHYLGKGAADAQKAIIEGLDKGPMPAEAAGAVASALERPSLARPPVLTGDQLTDATNALRQDILDPITQTRRRLGESIGDAYQALKGKPPISPEAAAELGAAARNIDDSLISPAGNARALLNRVKKFAPEQTRLGGMIQSDLEEAGHGELISRGTAPPTVEELRAQNYTTKQIEDIMKAYEARQPPTPDELRQLRQAVNTQLRTAKGGAAHTLAALQQAIDEQLMPMLPAGINRDRELYRGFISRFPWRDTNRINAMGTPRELSKYVFGGTPERAAEIIANSSPKGKQALAEALKDHALNAVNPDAPLEEQTKQVQKVLAPYIADGTAAQLFGKDRADELRTIFYAPAHRAQMADILRQPENQKAFEQEWVRVAKSSNKNQLAAAEAGLEKVIGSLPPPERQRFLEAAVPGAEMPALPTTQESLARGIPPTKEARIVPYARKRVEFSGPQTVARAAMGGGAGIAYGLSTAAAFATIAATSAGYRAILENGGAGVLAKMYASPSGRAIARTTFEGLAAIGSQATRQALKPEPVNPNVP